MAAAIESDGGANQPHDADVQWTELDTDWIHQTTSAFEDQTLVPGSALVTGAPSGRPEVKKGGCGGLWIQWPELHALVDDMLPELVPASLLGCVIAGRQRCLEKGVTSHDCRFGNGAVCRLDFFVTGASSCKHCDAMRSAPVVRRGGCRRAGRASMQVKLSTPTTASILKLMYSSFSGWRHVPAIGDYERQRAFIDSVVRIEVYDFGDSVLDGGRCGNCGLDKLVQTGISSVAMSRTCAQEKAIPRGDRSICEHHVFMKMIQAAPGRDQDNLMCLEPFKLLIRRAPVNEAAHAYSCATSDWQLAEDINGSGIQIGWALLALMLSRHMAVTAADCFSLLKEMFKLGDKGVGKGSIPPEGGGDKN